MDEAKTHIARLAVSTRSKLLDDEERARFLTHSKDCFDYFVLRHGLTIISVNEPVLEENPKGLVRTGAKWCIRYSAIVS